MPRQNAVTEYPQNIHKPFSYRWKGGRMWYIDTWRVVSSLAIAVSEVMIEAAEAEDIDTTLLQTHTPSIAFWHLPPKMS